MAHSLQPAPRSSRNTSQSQLLKQLGFVAALLWMFSSLLLAQTTAAAPTPSELELFRPVRPWEFLSALGTRAALLGNEAGQMEAWVYPLKILRDFRLRFHVGGEIIPAEALARTVTVRPESATVVYASDTFQVQETFFVPVQEQGAVIVVDVQTAQ